MRKEVIGDCTLYCGDCRDILPLIGKVDAVVTDPPYGIEDIVGGYGRQGKTIANDKDLSVCHDVLNLSYNNLSYGWLFAFYSCKVTAPFLNGLDKWDYYGDIVWDKLVPGMGGDFRYQHENVALLKKGNPQSLGKGFSVLRDARNPDQHPHQKPVSLMMKLLKIVPGKIILDPFMGSGSTGVACVKMGRKFIGIELDEDYFNIACQRIRDAYNQPDMFVELEKQPEQAVMEL